MTDKQAVSLVAKLRAGFPRQQLPKESLQLYAAYMRDLDFEQADAAVNRLICSSRFMPTVAEIREEVANGETAGLPDAEVAWGYVWKAISKFGAYRTPVFEHPEVAAAVDVIGWQAICLDENVAATRARFTDAYRSIRSRRVEAVQLGQYAPPERQLPARSGEQRSLAQVLRLAVGGDDD